MTREEKIKNYAKLLAVTGIRVEKGDEVWIKVLTLDYPDFITDVVEECYKAGAKNVEVEWIHAPIQKLNYKYRTIGNLGKISSYSLSKYKYMAKKLPSMLHIIGDDPDGLKGINPNKISKPKVKIYPKIKPYIDASDGKQKWCIAAIPGKEWAKKVFPKLDVNEAVDKLWDAILLTSRVDENDAVNNWNEHNKNLKSKCDKLNKLQLQYLEYKDPNGTDFKVELIKGAKWGGGSETDSFGRVFNPNIPSEEVFTSPLAGSCEGTLVASKPLSYQGQLIEDFVVTFKEGKVCKVFAKKNQALLEKMVKMDEGASKLGEVALVPFDSPINQANILFLETLFDENAACHVALGFGFKECLPNGSSLTSDEAHKLGINDSMIHVDFMVGTKNLDIVGIDYQGKKTQIFKNGFWAL